MGVRLDEPPRPAEEATPEVPIDPRIRARRIEVRRQAGRQRLARLADLGVLLGVAAVFVGALWTPLLDVDEVEVTGAVRLDRETVLATADVDAGDALIDVDPRAIGERIAELPWVLEVEVSRGVDGRVGLAVVEREPVATVGQGAGAVLVDEEGRGLATVGDTPATGLVVLTGLAVPAVGDFLGSEAAGALRLARALALAAPGSVAELDAGSLVARLAEGGEVAFTDATKLEAKIRSLETVLAQVDLTCLERIDLTLPANAVLTREEGCS